MRNILVILAHPKFEHSAVNQQMVNRIKDLENVNIRDLYELYPDFNIDVQAEQEILLMAEIVVWQHPFYWYSCPPLLKQWFDLVLEFNWAYGPTGIYLRNKFALSAITSGGTETAYSVEGKYGRGIQDYLLPFYQTVHLCNMHYLPPFHVAGTHRIEEEGLKSAAENYRKALLFLRDNPEIPKTPFQWSNQIGSLHGR